MSQYAFKTRSTWDFENIWVYVDKVNWDYPVLRSIYGHHIQVTDILVTIYNPHLYSDSTIMLGNLTLDGDRILFKDEFFKISFSGALYKQI